MKLTRFLRLLVRGPRHHALYGQPPLASSRGETNAVEAWHDGLCVAISWEPAKFPGKGSHVYRIAITRWYRDREGLWRNTSNLQAEDLPILSGLVAECAAKLQ